MKQLTIEGVMRMAQYRNPDGWNQRHESKLTGVTLPDGAKFYSTPSHGYLQVDINKLPANVSCYDYVNDHYAYLEEDCSLTIWLTQMGLIPMEDYTQRMISEIATQPAIELLNK